MVLDPAELLSGIPARSAGGRVWVAFSGGLDSTVLLHALASTGIAELRAVHVHHGLQAVADDWVSHCQAVCSELGVPLAVHHVHIDPTDPAGPEAAARSARRQVFSGILTAGDLLATAHHREDQAETVLLRLLRGSGVAGLGAMRAAEPFAAGQLWRPLLDVPRAAIRAYAEQHGLRWIDDPHNLDQRYARSWLRHEALPLIRARWPALDETLVRTAAHARESQALLTEMARADLAALGWHPDDREDADSGLSLSGLDTLSPARRRNVLRYWLGEQGIQAPSTAVLAEIETEFLYAAEDAEPHLILGAFELRRYRDWLIVMARLPPPPAGFEAKWLSGTLMLPAGCGALEAQRPPPWELTVRFIQGLERGQERLRPALNRPTRSLKNLFQEGGIPPWRRLRMPLLFQQGVLIAVADRWQDPGFTDRCAAENWHYAWLPAHLHL